MKVTKLLHKNLMNACSDIHNVRLAALMAAVNSAITSQQVTVTGLGRNLKSYSKTDTKHDIKRMDRLVGNNHLQEERKELYKYMAKLLIGQNKHPILIVDWSPIPGNEIFQLHRVSIPMNGRTLTLYEECYKEKLLNNTEVHNKFIEDLETLLPAGCQPIILSDAIYKTPWFKSIEAKNWYWLGRVRGNIQLSLDGKSFKASTEVMKRATTQAKSLGEVLYSKRTRFPCQGTLFQGKAKGNHKKKKRGGVSKDSVSLYYSKKSKQPWLLVSHLPKKYNTAKKIVQLYRCRMQIEEAFRDTKNQQYGLGLAQAKSKSEKRYNNLLLITALTLFLLWCIGQVAVNNKYHYRIQANTVRKKTVLSNIYLAMQIVTDPRYEVEEVDVRYILENIAIFVQEIS